MTSNARNRTRVILHVDLDAFYCKSRSRYFFYLPLFAVAVFVSNNSVTGQVEMKRVGIPPHVPCAVQQWEGLIAGETN